MENVIVVGALCQSKKYLVRETTVHVAVWFVVNPLYSALEILYGREWKMIGLTTVPSLFRVHLIKSNLFKRLTEVFSCFVSCSVNI